MRALTSFSFGTGTAVLFGIVFLRANATYWLGRGLVTGARRTRFEGRLRGPAAQRAERLVSTWGVLAVPLSFLTVGVQTAVNAGAGAARMPLRRYLPSVTVGAVLWALLYSTVGFGLFSAVAATVRSIGWGATAAILAAAVVLIGGMVLAWRARRNPRGPETQVGVEQVSGAGEPLGRPTEAAA